MNIYFVNRKSKLKSPFEITNSNGKRLMEVGDFLVRAKSGQTEVLLITEESNSWAACKCVCTSDKSLPFEGNCLLYSFNGIQNRTGNIDKVEQLLSIFNNTAIEDFINNILDILLFRCDQIDTNALVKIMVGTSSTVNEKEQSLDPTRSGLLFEKYLDPESIQYLEEALGEGVRLRAIYTNIKSQYPSTFRKALKSFLQDFPNGSIYDKSNNN